MAREPSRISPKSRTLEEYVKSGHSNLRNRWANLRSFCLPPNEIAFEEFSVWVG